MLLAPALRVALNTREGWDPTTAFAVMACHLTPQISLTIQSS